ncbi:MAG: TlyA family RNA methyltransferase [Clostridia bacterium]|nr:TlyA family RNA methyltransferase [Clostridia bacterium]
MAESERLDTRVVAEGYATGRDKAKELIRAGTITVDGKLITKPSATVADSAVVSCTVDAPRYVGRGGLKLEAALQALLPLPQPCVAMDVGASTGGFTHCMLLGGADRVYAVDVGHGQLHPTLASDPRVVNLEGTDIRNRDALSVVIPPHSVDLLSMDVSFISVRTVLPSVFDYLRDGARLLILIKPQFEAGRADIGKSGIVRDRRVHVRILRELCELFSASGCALQSLTASPITGGAGRSEGNIEYVATLVYGGESTILPDIRQLVDTTFSLH